MIYQRNSDNVRHLLSRGNSNKYGHLYLTLGRDTWNLILTGQIEDMKARG